MAKIAVRFAEEQSEKPFRVYSNYLEELAGVIGGRFGLEESLVDGVQAAMRAHPDLRRVQRRSLDGEASSELDRALGKAWSFLRRVNREVIEDRYDEEANAWLPEQAYYAIHHAMRAVALAASGRAPSEHRRVLNEISKEVAHGRMVFPWGASCSGCPQLGVATFSGVSARGEINPLKAPDPDLAEERIALLLRATRAKELDRRFDEARRQDVKAGRQRRNLGREEKLKKAKRLQPTTLFDFFYRTRKKAHYEDPDAFVLGAAGERDARRFGESLALVTDGTVAALECLVATYASRGVVARAVLNYADRISAAEDTPIGRRAQCWAGLVPATFGE